MHEHYSIGPEYQDFRLDRFLCQVAPSLSRSYIKKLIEQRNVLRNGQPVKPAVLLKRGDVVELKIPPPAPLSVQPEAIPLEILHEDSDLIVVNKPAGLVVHPVGPLVSGTLVNAILHQCGSLSGIGGMLRPGIVHRLDKQTSGAMVVAKSDRAHQGLAEQFRRRTIKKIYHALVHGSLKENQGTLRLAIGRHPTHRKKMSSKSRHPKEAVTHWEVKMRFRNFTFVEVYLQTGRTHQILVHFANIHHPVVGDSVYGGSSKRVARLSKLEEKKLLKGFNRHALHASTLGFHHPVQGADVEFTAPLPEELEKLLNGLRDIE